MGNVNFVPVLFFVALGKRITIWNNPLQLKEIKIYYKKFKVRTKFKLEYNIYSLNDKM